MACLPHIQRLPPAGYALHCDLLPIDPHLQTERIDSAQHPADTFRTIGIEDVVQDHIVYRERLSPRQDTDPSVGDRRSYILAICIIGGQHPAIRGISGTILCIYASGYRQSEKNKKPFHYIRD